VAAAKFSRVTEPLNLQSKRGWLGSSHHDKRGRSMPFSLHATSVVAACEIHWEANKDECKQICPGCCG